MKLLFGVATAEITVQDHTPNDKLNIRVRVRARVRVSVNNVRRNEFRRQLFGDSVRRVG